MVSAVARLAPLVLLAALAGCGPHRTVDLSPQPAATATVTPPTTLNDLLRMTAAPTATASLSASPSPSVAATPDGALTNGKHPGYLTTVDVANRTLTVDVVQFFTGDAATNAAREDGAAEVPPPNDYWIRNANPLLRTLPVSGDATITVNTLAGETSGDSAKDVAVTLQQLAGYHLANHLFWVTVDGGTITKIAEQFLP
jgi:hypothetical protein